MLLKKINDRSGFRFCKLDVILGSFHKLNADSKIVRNNAPFIGKSFKAIDEYSKNGQPKAVIQQELITNILLIVGTTLIAGFLTFLMRQTLIVMSRHVEFDLKNEIFKQYEVLTQNFYKRNRTGDLMSRITEDVARVRMYVGPAVMYTINTIIRFAW